MLKLKCYNCGYEKANVSYENFVCPNCKSPMLFSSFEDESILEKIRTMFNTLTPEILSSIWVFKEAFPIPKDLEIISLGEGGTPLLNSKRLSERLGFSSLYLKDETKNPTNSFRDRAAALVVSIAKYLGHKRIVCATNGNMGASVAAYASQAGLKSFIIVPKNVDYGKVAQISAYGGHLITYGNSVDDCIEYSRKYSKEKNAYNATPELNTLSLEGQKTISYEIFLQLGYVPDYLVIPTGSGSSVVSLWKGFLELYNAGIIERIPRMIVAQPKNCAPIVEKFQGIEEGSKKEHTAALGLYVMHPYFSDLVVKILRDTRGFAAAVEESEIIESEKLLAKSEAIFAEPASAVGIAAIKSLRDLDVLDKDDTIVALITGSGLKASYILQVFQSKVTQRSVYPKLSTKIEILRYLSFGESYGYEIWKKVRPDLKFQTIYQHIQELKERGLIKEIKKKRRKYYVLTEKGRHLLSALEEIALLL
ncbi:MAG: threonine synthase [Candidatus Asgardarchaeia archaeon]